MSSTWQTVSSLYSVQPLLLLTRVVSVSFIVIIHDHTELFGKYVRPQAMLSVGDPFQNIVPGFYCSTGPFHISFILILHVSGVSIGFMNNYVSRSLPNVGLYR